MSILVLQQHGLDGVTSQLFIAIGGPILSYGYEPGRRWLMPHVQAGLASLSLSDELRRWFRVLSSGLRQSEAIRGQFSDDEVRKWGTELASLRPQGAGYDAGYTMQRSQLALRLGEFAEARSLLAVAKGHVANAPRLEMYMLIAEFDVAVAERNEAEVRRIVAQVGARRSDCLRQILDAQQICRIEQVRILSHWRLFARDIGDEAAAKQAEADIRSLVPGSDEGLLAFWLSDAVRFPWEVKRSSP